MADTSRYDQHVGQDFLQAIRDQNREKNRKALESAVLILGAQIGYDAWRKYRPSTKPKRGN